jgi:hypothetical protein
MANHTACSQGNSNRLGFPTNSRVRRSNLIKVGLEIFLDVKVVLGFLSFFLKDLQGRVKVFGGIKGLA